MKNKLTRYKNNPKNVTFDELKSLLEAFGFEIRNYSGGSHFSVSHTKYDVIQAMEPNSIPTRKPHVLKIYVTRAIVWIEKVIILQEAEEAEKNEKDPSID